MISLIRSVSSPLLVASLAIGLSGTALAQGAKAGSPPTRQQIAENHKKAAAMHEKMATCLASKKTLEQCQEEMAATCGESFGTNCPGGGPGMMGMHGGRGMMGGGPCMNWMLNPGGEATGDAPQKPVK